MVAGKDDKLLKRLEKLNTKDCLWIYILSILKKRPSHAYLLRGEIKKLFGFTPGTVTAYRVLYHLSSKGFVKKSLEGRRKIYSLTSAGRQELKSALEFYKERIKKLS